jgi:hypothetical protein
MISCSIEATLILIYLLAHYLPSPPLSPSHPRRLLHRTRASFLSRFHTATTSSIHTLYATATLLSYAIVTAALSIFITHHHLKKSFVDIYMNQHLILTPSSSVFPVLAMHTLLPDWKRKALTPSQISTGWEGRNGFPKVLGAVLYAFCLVIVWYIFVKGVKTTNPKFESGGKKEMLGSVVMCI